MATNTLTGTTGNDILNAPGSVVTDVVGLAGADTITLNLSNDLADAGSGDDQISLGVTGNSINTVYGGAGADVVTVGTAVLTNQAYIRGDAGNDSITLAGGAGYTTNNGVFVAGNAGNDTIAITAAATLATVGGGQDADSIRLADGGTSSSVRAGKGKDTLNLAGTITGSTVSGNEGFDVITASALTGTTSLIGGGKGGDNITLGANAYASVVGGYLNDSITGLAGFAGGVIYGDKVGVTTASSGTGASADGADLISFTAASISAASSIYGSGGNDTIKLNGTASSGAAVLIVDGGNNADLIGATTVIVGGAGNATLSGGSGHDTIKFASINSSMIFGGNGIDSIAGDTVSAVGVSINGGAGDDSITFMGSGNGSAQAIVTINGGTGADVITLGTYTASIDARTVNSGNVIGNVVYGSGDKLILEATNQVAVGANWFTDTQIEIVASRAADISAIVGLCQAGSLVFFTDGDDLVMGVTANTGSTTSSQVNIIGGASLIKTTAVGTVTADTTNFGFTVTTANTDIVLTFE